MSVRRVDKHRHVELRVAGPASTARSTIDGYRRHRRRDQRWNGRVRSVHRHAVATEVRPRATPSRALHRSVALTCRRLRNLAVADHGRRRQQGFASRRSRSTARTSTGLRASAGRRPQRARQRRRTADRGRHPVGLQRPDARARVRRRRLRRVRRRRVRLELHRSAVYRIADGAASADANHAAGQWFYADATLDRRRRRLIAVSEDHSDPGREPVNTLVSIPLDGDASAGRRHRVGIRLLLDADASVPTDRDWRGSPGAIRRCRGTGPSSGSRM